ncbi:hypothetical protein B0H12DRAFT_1156042, partial [Mycena haematopus]
MSATVGGIKAERFKIASLTHIIILSLHYHSMPAIFSRFVSPICQALWRLVRFLFGGSTRVDDA